MNLKKTILQHFEKKDKDFITCLNLTKKDTKTNIICFFKYYLTKIICFIFCKKLTFHKIKTGFSIITCYADWTLDFMPFLFNKKLKSFKISL